MNERVHKAHTIASRSLLSFSQASSDRLLWTPSWNMAYTQRTLGNWTRVLKIYELYSICIMYAVLYHAVDSIVPQYSICLLPIKSTTRRYFAVQPSEKRTYFELPEVGLHLGRARSDRAPAFGTRAYPEPRRLRRQPLDAFTDHSETALHRLHATDIQYVLYMPVAMMCSSHTIRDVNLGVNTEVSYSKQLGKCST